MKAHQEKLDKQKTSVKEEKKEEPEVTIEQVPFIVSPTLRTGHFLKKVWAFIKDNVSHTAHGVKLFFKDTKQFINLKKKERGE